MNHRQIDDLFKSVVQPLETAFEYRHSVEQSLCELNEMCGLPDISNVKQCVRKIASRLQKANLVGAVTIRNQSDVSIFHLDEPAIRRRITVCCTSYHEFYSEQMHKRISNTFPFHDIELFFL